jgi:hypothetical protein
MKKRPIRIEGAIAFVPLTKDYEAVIDAADLPLVDCLNWSADVDRSVVYAKRTDCSGPRRRTVMMHRVLMGDPSGVEIDHVDGDGLNNRRSNLRWATDQQNAHNRRISSLNTSGFKGVYWDKARGAWRATITLNCVRRHLGYFDTPEAAHAAYVKASASLHGEFGRAA